MIRPLRILLGIVIGILELLMVFAFITMLPKWLNAQSQRYHPASEAAAIALHERHLRVTGTATSPTHHHSIVESRFGDGPITRTETYSSRPDRILVRSTVADKPVVEFGYDGTTGWSSTPETGLVRLSTAALDELRASASSMGTPTIDTTVRLVAIPRQRFDDQLVDGIKLVTASGDTAYRYYAVSTGYMVGMLFRTPSYPPMDSMTTVFRDYKRIGPRTEYFTIIMRSAGMEATTRTLHLDHEPIDAARFKAPAGVP